MIINITQHCTLRCPHCMQNACPERTEMMSKEVFIQAMQFAKGIGSQMVLLSGGEPTTHPMFFEFLQLALDNFISVSVLSNGTFIRDHAFTEKFASMVADRNGFFLQISSFKGLYANYDEVHKPHLKAWKLFGKKVFISDEVTDEIQMKPLGRACSGEWHDEAKRVNGFPSCINAALVMAQLVGDLKNKIGAVLEFHHRFCLPIVSWDGSIRLGESEQCKVVANVSEPLRDINEKMIAFRPCGGCDSFKWHLSNPKTENERTVHKILYNANERVITMRAQSHQAIFAEIESLLQEKGVSNG